MKLFRFFIDVFNVSDRARKIRADEYRRKTSKHFAITSIIYSLLMFAAAIGGAYLFTMFDRSLLAIFIIVIAAGLLGGALVCMIGSLVRLITQFTINHGTMTWVALLLFLAALAGTIVVIVMFML